MTPTETTNSSPVLNGVVDKPRPIAKTKPKHRFAKLTKWLVLALVLAIAYALYIFVSVQTVDSVVPRWTPSIETLATAGIVEGRTETTLGADMQGTLAELYVEENDRVRKGELLARVQSRTAESQVGQASASLTRALAQLRQAKSGPTSDEIMASEAHLRQAEEGIAYARTVLENARIGVGRADSAIRDAATLVERMKANLDQARSRRDLAEKTLSRTRQLASEGALAGARVDEAQSAFDVAAAAVSDATEAVNGAENALKGARLGKDSAATEVKSAESSQRSASAVRDAAAAELSHLRSLPQAEAVGVAAAAVHEAEAAFVSAKSASKNADIRAPFDGTVTKILCERGASVSAAGVIRLVETGNLEAKADVDESNLDQLKVGQRAILTTSAEPEKQIEARITSISSHVESGSGTVEIVAIATKKANLWAGQTVDINIVINEKASRLLVPTSAVKRKGDETVLFVVENGRAKARPVRTGQTSGRDIAILQGLTEQDHVIRDGANLEDGKRIRVAK